MSNLENKFGSMTVVPLKDELKLCPASLRGRKKDLIERCVFYEKNQNFGFIRTNVEDAKTILTPDTTFYKDINLSSIIPRLTDEHISQYLSMFEKDNVVFAKEMYENGYLHYSRYCMKDSLYFVASKCEAQIMKHVTHDVNMSLAMDSEIRECSCECIAGKSTKAHCKHVCVTFYGVRGFAQKKPAVTKQSCTEKLQTFNHPSKRFAGSPMAAKDVVPKRQKNCKRSNPDEPEDDDDPDYDIWYKNYFDNLIINRGVGNNMSLKQLTKPANQHAVSFDHDYLKYMTKYNILRELGLVHITSEEI
ncbi:hypothetical protein QAD02_007513 [Eretmocerus hayati]|uniref:Uncharacterized protein n=1 Tax=Eretmocerus hayati TaxID=131215 RepID=A0ACC2N4N0_9HYME|nr:hypothetical protein QAD02_007513 [Eretmocerus hayati]